MTTRNVVPRADSEGGIGTVVKRWLSGRFVSIFCSNLSIGENTNWHITEDQETGDIVFSNTDDV